MQNLKRSLLWQRHNVTARQYWKNKHTSHQRWSSRECSWPRGHFRGHIFNSLASKPQILKNCSVLGSRTALFFELLKSCWKTSETSRKICEDLFLFCSSEDHLKKNFRRPFLREKNFDDLFFMENTCVCVFGPRPCPREGLSLALASEFFCVFGLGLEPHFLDSTSASHQATSYKVFKITFNFL